MTDLHSLLSQAAHADGAPAPDSVVDADLVRGRRALTHRRMRRTGTRSALAAVVVIGTFAAVHPGGSSSGTTATPATAKAPATATAPATTKAPATAKATTAATKIKPVNLSVKLVAYTGTQPAGYTVDSVPAGWEIQGVNNFALAIAPTGFADQDINDFKGKLVVMLLSKDEKPPTTGTPVDLGVAGTGRISHYNPGEPILSFKDTAGHWLDIQVPAALHWTDAQVVAFGSAVHANPTAEAGVG